MSARRTRRACRAFGGCVALALPLALASALPARAAQQEEVLPPPPTHEGSAAASAAPTPVFDRRLGPAEILERCQQLALRYPEHAAELELGRTRADQPIPLLVLGDRRVGDPDARPALLFAPASCGPGHGHGAELGLALAWSLAAGAASDPAVAAVLAERTVYVLPLPDPDGRAEPGGDVASVPVPAAAPAFEASFPLGWWPERLRPGGGAMPLEDPAARAVHGFLEARGNLVLLVSCSPEVPPGSVRLWAGAQLPAEDARDFAALAGLAPGIFAWPELTRGGGGLLDYAYQGRGIYPIGFVEPTGLTDGPPVAAWLRESAAHVLRLLDEFPRLQLTLAARSRLGPGLWQLDVDLENPGAVATSSVLARRRGGAPGVTLRLTGATVLARAHRVGEELAFQVAGHEAEREAGSFAEPGLRGGEERRLRFVVEGSDGTTIRLAAASAWCRESELLVTLED